MKQIKEFFAEVIYFIREDLSYIKEDMQSNKLSDILEGLMLSSILLLIGIGICFILFMLVVHPITTLFAIFIFIFMIFLIIGIKFLLEGIIFLFGYSLAWIIRSIRNLVWRKQNDS